MGKLLDSIESKKGGLLWLDATDYAARLLAGGHAPWLDVAASVAWQRKAQGLLRADVLPLPLAPVAAKWVEANDGLRMAMSAKKRLLAPLRTLLADEALRAHLVELVRGLRASFGGAPLVLVLPSPRLWPALAYRLAFADAGEIEVTADDADAAAVYIADFLRAFGDAGVDAVALEEDAASAPRSMDDLGMYQPVLNLAQHYRWDVGLLTPRTGAFDAAALDYVIAPGPQPGARCNGLRLAPGFWQGEAAPPATFRYAGIPADLQPEAVLDRLASLR